ncbi:MAG: helix-hairpin-helix domain-containing protein, partial [Bacteroidales bacterium]|nr:helix-hairpin-helix domain-containing protein [Bacteroidales bacterium]
LLRGANEGVLSLKIEVKEEFAFERISAKVYDKKKRPSPELKALITDIIADSYNRLLASSIENETLKIAKEKADIESVNIFGENLRELLLAPPVGQKRTLAIDPGFRTGCKVVCLDSEGNLLHNDTIYPHPPVNERVAAMKKITQLVESYKIEVIAIGNGTAGRETEGFIKKIALPDGIKVYSVSEDGASIYSASPIAREEFPQYDVTVRGAVSIGRRLMDPLAELVKIDPKSIGVGQYQHDVDQALLKERLDNTVESCVNSVGVNLNTASRHLLSYVSGVGPALALNIVEYRKNNGAFKSRAELSKVKLLGPKAFEQCAGFMRIPGAENPLDNSAVHPERYRLIEQMAADLNCTLVDLMQNSEKRAAVDLSKYVSEDVGLPTLNDIMAELAKPGRDPRAAIKVFEFSDEIRTIEDVQIGMELPGIVVNITAFGAFVDIGIKDNGLIHISKMGKAKLKIHQHILTRVEDVDLRRHRIALSLK